MAVGLQRVALAFTLKLLDSLCQMDLPDTHPRANLVTSMTPLTPLPRMSGHLGVELWIKRDDLAGTTLGGNKSRQLEYYLGAAQQAQADTILITGAVQSNFVRTAVACAASVGMRAVVQLEERVPDMDAVYHSSGNVLLSRVLGAEVMRYPNGEDEAGADAAVRARADELRAAGRRPYVIPLSVDNPPLGAMGYMRAAEEILSQADDFEHVIVASGSGLTHAGLLAGLRGQSSSAKVTGSCVRRGVSLQRDRIARVLKGLNRITGTVPIMGDDIRLWDGALAPGYGKLSQSARDAMALMARLEGILLDPVYTAKAFAAIPALVADREIEPNSRVLFVHTGGLASLFAYQTDIEAEF